MEPVSYQSPAVLKERFRAYLDQEGVIDGLTRALIALYEEPVKPASAVGFVKQVLGEREPAVSADAAALAHENASLRRELQQAQAALATAREQLAATQRKLAAAVDGGGATA